MISNTKAESKRPHGVLQKAQGYVRQISQLKFVGFLNSSLSETYME